MQCKILVRCQHLYLYYMLYLVCICMYLYSPRNNNRIFCVPQTVSIIQLAKSTLHCSFSLQPLDQGICPRTRAGPGWPNSP